MNLFIAGVGNVELFKGTDSVLVSKTLVDSSINLSVSLEDIRAGAGAKLYGKYAHTSTMTMKLTDAMFRMEFLAANIGADILAGGSAVAVVGKTVGDDGAVDISDITPMPLYEGAKTVVWIAKKGTEDYVVYDVANVKTGFAKDTEVCVRYIKSNDAGEHLKVSANFIPDTMTAILTAPLFAGDENNLESSTKVGTLTITIPRFMLNGTTDLSMTMTGATQMALEGSALAVNDADCENNDGYYAIIDKVINGQNYMTNLANLVPYYEYIKDKADSHQSVWNLKVFGVYNNGTRRVIDRNHFAFWDHSSYAASKWTDDGILYTESSDRVMDIDGGFIIELLDEQGNKIQPLKTLNMDDYEWWTTSSWVPGMTAEVSNFYCVTSPEVWEK